MKSPYEVVNYNFLQQKAFSLYLNNKKKYEKLRFIVKPLQVFFRDYLDYNSDLSKVNYFHRSDKNLINTDVTTRFGSKIGLTKAKKLILNSRLQYRKILSNWKVSDESVTSNTEKVSASVIKRAFDKLTVGALTNEQLKRIMK